jgi:guanidinopropionase
VTPPATPDVPDTLHPAMTTLGWWGPATLFRCPFDPDPGHCEIALAGIPHSSGNGSTERDQHLAPRTLRDISMAHRRVHARWGLDPWNACRINDVGDVPLPSAMVNDLAVREIEAFFRDLDAAGARPVSIGGDHSVSLPVLRAIGGPRSRAGRPLAVVHFDAHHDTYDALPDWLGVVDSAAHWASRAAREGHVDAARSVQIGMRGHGDSDNDAAQSEELGYRVVTRAELKEAGADAVIAETRERVGDAPVYVSFDLDVLDTTVAPAVSNPAFGEEGLGIDEASRLLEGLRGLDVVGADVVCLMPTRDNPGRITALNAAIMLFEEICLIADRIGSGAR